jgi:predicted nucleic acid-binding protein
MIFLADVNFLLFLADSNSPYHAAAKSFFQRASGHGWATCPLTENGFIRILGNPQFPGSPGNTRAARMILQQWKSTPVAGCKTG